MFEKNWRSSRTVRELRQFFVWRSSSWRRLRRRSFDPGPRLGPQVGLHFLLSAAQQLARKCLEIPSETVSKSKTFWNNVSKYKLYRNFSKFRISNKKFETLSFEFPNSKLCQKQFTNRKLSETMFRNTSSIETFRNFEFRIKI